MMLRVQETGSEPLANGCSIARNWPQQPVFDKLAGRTLLSTLPLLNRPSLSPGEGPSVSCKVTEFAAQKVSEAVRLCGYTQDHKGAEDPSPARHTRHNAVQHALHAGSLHRALQQPFIKAGNLSCYAERVKRKHSVQHATVPNYRQRTE